MAKTKMKNPNEGEKANQTAGTPSVGGPLILNGPFLRQTPPPAQPGPEGSPHWPGLDAVDDGDRHNALTDLLHWHLLCCHIGSSGPKKNRREGVGRLQLRKPMVHAHGPKFNSGKKPWGSQGEILSATMGEKSCAAPRPPPPGPRASRGLSPKPTLLSRNVGNWK